MQNNSRLRSRVGNRIDPVKEKNTTNGYTTIDSLDDIWTKGGKK